MNNTYYDFAFNVPSTPQYAPSTELLEVRDFLKDNGVTELQSLYCLSCFVGKIDESTNFDAIRAHPKINTCQVHPMVEIGPRS